MFCESYFVDFVGVLLLGAKIELSRVGELSQAEHLQGARVTLVPG